MKVYENADVIEMLRRRQGKSSLRDFAKQLKLSAAYLSDVFRGNRTPGPRLLEYLGLRRETTVKHVYVKEEK